MADTPTTPQSVNIAESLHQVTKLQQEYTDAMAKSSDMMGIVKDAMASVDAILNRVGVSLSNLTALTEQQIEALSLVGSGFISAREAFAGFANVDYSGLSTFREQLNDIQEALFSGGMAAEAAQKEIERLSKSLLGAGVAQGVINKARAAGLNPSNALLEVIKQETLSMLTHADNMNRAQTAYVQMAAKTGELGDIWNAAGDSLQNMDYLLERQQRTIRDSREATGLSTKAVEDWYAQLGQIPGALNAITNMTDKHGKHTSMLTAVIQAATGTGRTQADVMKDLNTAFRDYGLVGEKALLFSTRMSDISTRLKAPIDDVTNAIRASTDAFKMFITGQEAASKSSESLAKFYESFGKALESTGLSASQSMELLNNQMQVASKFSIGQLSFISQHTGGAGGLMGAAQEMLKLQTDPGAVVRDAMNVLKQQFGQIVTVKDAATSQAAASLWIKQSSMLQQLLGPLAPNQAAANRMLEAMKNEQITPQDFESTLKDTSVQDAVKKGAEMEAKSYNVLTVIRNLLEQLRDISDIGASRRAARFTAGATNQDLTDMEKAVKAVFLEHMRTSAEAGGIHTAKTAMELEKGKVDPTAGQDYGDAMRRWAFSLKEIPIFAEAYYDDLVGAIKSGDEERIAKQEAQYKQLQAIFQEQARMLQGNPAARKQALQEAQVYGALYATARDQVRNATHASIANKGTGEATVPQGIGATAGPPPNPTTNIHITGTFKMDCPYCHKLYDISPQMGVAAGPSGQAKQ
jgi:hypothetical protein